MYIRGKVVSGLGVGKDLGYRTANLEYNDSKVIPSGVYAAKTEVVGVNVYQSVAVVGAREFQDKPLVEIFIFDFGKDLYGKELSVELLDKVSEIEQFKDTEALLKKIKQDILKVKEYFRLCLPE